MPDRTHELCPDCPEPIFRKVAKKNLWKTRVLDSKTSPRFPKFQQPSTDFLRTGSVLLGCEVKVKSKSLKPAAAGLFLEAFHTTTLKNSALRARAKGKP
jgi:hypothetical protein